MHSRDLTTLSGGEQWDGSRAVKIIILNTEDPSLQPLLSIQKVIAVQVFTVRGNLLHRVYSFSRNFVKNPKKCL